MKGRKLGIFGFCLLLMQFFDTPLYAQTLSQIYVSPSGNVLGAIFDSHPGFPSDIYVNNAGLLVWVEMEVPDALIEVYSDGYIRLIEEGPSAHVSYETGQIQRIGNLRFEYESGRIRQIGNLPFHYESGQMRRMGDVRFLYDDNGRIRRVGGIRIEYVAGRISRISDLPFNYDQDGLIRNIGDVRFRYEYGTLKDVTGNVPGVSITVTSVVEFRKKLRRE